MVRQNKPECLTLASFFEDSLIFASKARSLPIEWSIVGCFIKAFLNHFFFDTNGEAK